MKIYIRTKIKAIVDTELLLDYLGRVPMLSEQQCLA